MLHFSFAYMCKILETYTLSLSMSYSLPHLIFMDFLMILGDVIIYYSPNTSGHNCPQSGAMLSSNFSTNGVIMKVGINVIITIILYDS